VKVIHLYHWFISIYVLLFSVLCASTYLLRSSHPAAWRMFLIVLSVCAWIYFILNSLELILITCLDLEDPSSLIPAAKFESWKKQFQFQYKASFAIAVVDWLAINMISAHLVQTSAESLWLKTIHDIFVMAFIVYIAAEMIQDYILEPEKRR